MKTTLRYALLCSLCLGTVPACDKDDDGNDDSDAKITRLTIENDALRSRLDTLETALAEATPTIEAAKKLTAVVQIDEVGDVVIEGANLRVRNGLGRSMPTIGIENHDELPNGKGNIIIGYDENHADHGGSEQDKSGSHYLVIGPYHSYTSWTGIVSGFENHNNSMGGAILSGVYNTVTGTGASTVPPAVLSGNGNYAIGSGAAVVGGAANTAAGEYAVVGGGGGNQANSVESTIGGGQGLTDGGMGSFKPTGP